MCGALESLLDLKPGSNSAFGKRLLSALIRFRIENGNFGQVAKANKAAIHEGVKSPFRVPTDFGTTPETTL